MLHVILLHYLRSYPKLQKCKEEVLCVMIEELGLYLNGTVSPEELKTACK